MRRVVFGAVGGLEDGLVGAGEEDAELLAGDAHVGVEEVGVAGGVAEEAVDAVEKLGLPGEEALGAAFLGAPLALLEHLLVPVGNHGVEDDGDAALVGPAGGGGGVALAANGDPDEVGLDGFVAAQAPLDVAEGATVFDHEEANIPPQLLEEGDVDAVAGVFGPKAAPEEDGFHGRCSSRSSM